MSQLDSQPQALWQSLQGQLDELAEQLAHGFELGNDALATQLAERSAAWSVPPKVQANSTLETLIFTLGDETYGIGLSHIDEVLPLRHITPLPGTPAFVSGIVNVRGRIVSVTDLRVFFDMPKRGLADRNHLLVLQSQDMEFGLLADRIIGVQSIDLAGLQTELASLTGLRRSFLKGISPQQWVILDGERLLADATLRVDEIS